ncbi:DUF559 domain-containing protein [Bosea vaviloviae]|uniref:DUF559 domain-containing protein n=1 Tax=Bosea vaviloviae TaxID=1526658 RepID=UPI001FCDB5DA|nr:DUF559 domain-containing protein [Bosea vaviloviae]
MDGEARWRRNNRVSQGHSAGNRRSRKTSSGICRARRLDGLKFRRQAPLLGYTVDFLCFERKLVVELDGRQHDVERDYDAARSEEIERHGFMVIRFGNETVLNDRDVVIARIREGAGTATEIPLLQGEGKVR